MSKMLGHVRIDLAGPFHSRQVKTTLARGKAGYTKATLSTEQIGRGHIRVIVGCHSKATEFAQLRDKSAARVTHAEHGFCFMRCGLTEWIDGYPFSLEFMASGGAVERSIGQLGVVFG